MSSRTSSPPLRIEPTPSRIYLLLLVAMHLLAMASVAMAGVALYWKLLSWLALLLYFIWLYRGELRLQGQHAVRLALWDDRQQWRIQLGRGSMQGAQLLPDSLNLPFLVILRFKTLSGARYNLPLFRDSLDPDSHRRLRARLKVYAAGLGASGEQR